MPQRHNITSIQVNNPTAVFLLFFFFNFLFFCWCLLEPQGATITKRWCMNTKFDSACHDIQMSTSTCTYSMSACIHTQEQKLCDGNMDLRDSGWSWSNAQVNTHTHTHTHTHTFTHRKTALHTKLSSSQMFETWVFLWAAQGAFSEVSMCVLMWCVCVHMFKSSTSKSQVCYDIQNRCVCACKLNPSLSVSLL